MHGNIGTSKSTAQIVRRMSAATSADGRYGRWIWAHFRNQLDVDGQSRPVHLPFIRVHHEGDMNACTKLYANVVDLVNAELELPTYVFGK